MLNDVFLLFCSPNVKTFWEEMQQHPHFTRVDMVNKEHVFTSEAENTTLVILDEKAHPLPGVLLSHLLSGGRTPICFVFTQHIGRLPDYGGVKAIPPGPVRYRDGRSAGLLALALENLMRDQITRDEVVSSLNAKLVERLTEVRARESLALALEQMMKGRISRDEIIAFLDKKIGEIKH